MTGEELESWIADKNPARQEMLRAESRRLAPSHSPALGFHIPGIYDKVLDINECLLMAEPSDSIRNEVRRYALERRLPFYDFREHHTGFLRNHVRQDSLDRGGDGGACDNRQSRRRS
ncbi:MAG: hypothetical protein MZV63_69775 [Marinilabiliales bacterium]|nr:hypothetical protein [Marinilabiliales bacterium]